MEFGFLTNSNIVEYLLFSMAVVFGTILAFKKKKILDSLKIKSRNYKLSIFIFFFILTAIFIAGLRPYYGKYELKIPGKYSSLIVAVDISDSMLAKDAFPTRLDSAKRKLFDLVSYLKKTDNAFKLGIVLFSGSAYTYCPLTKDLDVVSNYVKSIDNKLIETGGSDLDLGLQASIAAFKSAKISSGQVLFLTDGEDEEFQI
ncbi:MAG: VWA domain-containing protein, partial [Bdellovibrionales bacterium]|nr:VWA domain-containing protein [Bdellovibrionales bacterium]